jgi:hypothetical protein
MAGFFKNSEKTEEDNKNEGERLKKQEDFV